VHLISAPLLQIVHTTQSVNWFNNVRDELRCTIHAKLASMGITYGHKICLPIFTRAYYKVPLGF